MAKSGASLEAPSTSASVQSIMMVTRARWATLSASPPWRFSNDSADACSSVHTQKSTKASHETLHAAASVGRNTRPIASSMSCKRKARCAKESVNLELTAASSESGSRKGDSTAAIVEMPRASRRAASI